MEFPFNINSIFPNEITLLDSRLSTGENGLNDLRRHREELISIINEMGAASSKAQGLNGVITSASRLTVSTHHLYVLKDPEANGGSGAAIGILRVGYKKLFVYDRDGHHHEFDPLCVLDFYVHESRQRTGCGKQLFDAMILKEQKRPVDFAIDRPSPKFLAFLAKHYNLKVQIPQVNNFVVFEGFFTNNVNKDRARKSSHQPTRAPSYTNSRKGLHRGWSKQATSSVNEESMNKYSLREVTMSGHHYISSWMFQRESLTDITLPTSSTKTPSATSIHDSTAPTWSRSPSLPSEQKQSSSMGAQRSQYSRHMSPTLQMSNKPSAITEIVVDTTKVYSPPLIRRRNGPAYDSSEVAKTMCSPQDVTPDTRATMSDSKQTSERKSLAVPALWSENNDIPSWKKSTYDAPPAAGRFASSGKYYNHTRLW